MGSQRLGNDWATFTFIVIVNSKPHVWSSFPLTDRIIVIILSRIVSRLAWVTTKYFHVNQKGPSPLVGKRGVTRKPWCPQLLSLLCCVDHHGHCEPWPSGFCQNIGIHPFLSFQPVETQFGLVIISSFNGGSKAELLSCRQLSSCPSAFSLTFWKYKMWLVLGRSHAVTHWVPASWCPLPACQVLSFSFL